MMLPTLFISHGAPTLLLSDAPAKGFMAGVPAELPERPRAIVMVSAHWETRSPMVTAPGALATIHDFGGFPRALYEMRYPANGDTAWTERVLEVLSVAGFPAGVDPRRGLDHGAWVPLMLMYPEANVPVIQLSVQYAQGVAHHLALGRALAPLREEGVLIVGSGSFTHDLSSFSAHRGFEDYAEPEWVTSFADWFDAALVSSRIDDLVGYRDLAPNARRNHSTEEHLMPLFVALGAAGEGAHSKRLHASTTHAVLRMDAYAFGGTE